MLQNTMTPTSDHSPITVIDEITVRTALDNLRYTSTRRPDSPLQYLLLVEQRISLNRLSNSPYARKLELAQLLIDIICDELARHRWVFGRTLSAGLCTLSDAKVAIAEDAKSANPELLGWSWLYYYYVRVELNMTYAVFSAAAHTVERTIRRYRDHGIGRLTQKLVVSERQAVKVY